MVHSEQDSPGVGELQGNVPHQQLAVQFLLHPGDVGAQGLLGNMQLFSGFGEAALLGHRYKVFHGRKIHISCASYQSQVLPVLYTEINSFTMFSFRVTMQV